MDRDELIKLVTQLLAAATQREDQAIIVLCEELGRRLVAEATAPAPVEVKPAECEVCAARKQSQTRRVKKWRQNKRKAKVVEAIEGGE